MINYLSAAAKSPLFKGIGEEDLASLLSCLAARERRWQKGEFVLRAGDEVDSLGLVLDGRCHIVREDFWGNRNIVAEVGPGEIFAESYACAAGARLTVSVLAVERSSILFLDAGRLLAACPSACPFHTKLLGSLVSVLAGKNIYMNEKLDHTAQRSTRRKLLSYLSAASRKCGSASFEIPFDRQELADYLAVDRSAMSAELGRMRDEGLLEFERNRFVLKVPASED